MRSQEIDPIRFEYTRVKAHAKERKKSFTITIEWFRQFCEETGYMTRKGRNSLSYSIDRINPNLGYEPGNLQILLLADNSRKQMVDLKIRMGNYPTSEELEELRRSMANDATPFPEFHITYDEAPF